MKLLMVIAWRNTWRHPVRSSAVMAALAVGLLGGNLVAGLATGMLNQVFRETIENQVSHIQLHHPDFPADPEVRHRIDDGQAVFEQISSREGIRAVSARLAFDGMVASAGTSAGVRIVGVEPEIESRTTGLDRRLSEGRFLEEPGRLPSIVIGEELARRLGSETGSRIVLTFQDVGGELVSASFRVEGIFSLVSRAFEERTVFVKASELGELAGAPGAVTEIAVLLEDGDRYREVTEETRELHPGLKVRNWEDLSPTLYFQQRMLGESIKWVMAIFIMGVAFGILNTILMSVLERSRELGVLMAVGMRRTRVFAVVVTETLLLSVAGGAAGLALSFLVVRRLGRTGIDLSVVGGGGLRDLGISPEIFFDIDPGFYLETALIVIVFTVMAALYPAFRAIRLQPAEAVRKE